jgi:hypothetical protein
MATSAPAGSNSIRKLRVPERAIRSFDSAFRWRLYSFGLADPRVATESA